MKRAISDSHKIKRKSRIFPLYLPKELFTKIQTRADSQSRSISNYLRCLADFDIKQAEAMAKAKAPIQ